jgi:Crinkler effector protein N-terminal domain
MTNDDKYKLTCLVEGDKNAFPIAISRDADIDQLTQLIFQKGQLDPSGLRNPPPRSNFLEGLQFPVI